MNVKKIQSVSTQNPRFTAVSETHGKAHIWWKKIQKEFPAKLGNGNLVFEPPIWKMLHNQTISSPILGVNMKNLSNYLQV